jgi:hypothetical protein
MSTTYAERKRASALSATDDIALSPLSTTRGLEGWRRGMKRSSMVFR